MFDQLPALSTLNVVLPLMVGLLARMFRLKPAPPPTLTSALKEEPVWYWAMTRKPAPV